MLAVIWVALVIRGVCKLLHPLRRHPLWRWRYNTRLKGRSISCMLAKVAPLVTSMMTSHITVSPPCNNSSFRQPPSRPSHSHLLPNPLFHGTCSILPMRKVWLWRPERSVSLGRMLTAPFAKTCVAARVDISTSSQTYAACNVAVPQAFPQWLPTTCATTLLSTT